MVRISNFKNGGIEISIYDDESTYLFGNVLFSSDIPSVWKRITDIMSQLNSNACLVVDETETQHVIYRLYEDGTKEKLPITVRNPQSITVSKNE